MALPDWKQGTFEGGESETMEREGMSKEKTAFEKINWPMLFLSVLISFTIGFVSMRAWEIDFNVPTGTANDEILGEMLYKSIYEDGLRGAWFQDNIGAPDTSSLVDVPFLDMDIILETLILRKLMPSPHAMIYAMYLLSFALSSFTMYLLLSHLRVSLSFRLIFSVAYSIAPYHFYRAITHLTLSHYYPVPLAVYLALLIYEEEFHHGLIPDRYRGTKWKKWIPIPACAVLGLGNVYYAYFGLLCLCIALMAKMISKPAGKRIHTYYREFLYIFLLLFFVFLSLLPKILYTYRMGLNTAAGVRHPSESEFYALQIILLILPCSFNKVPFLAELHHHYTSNSWYVSDCFMASLGFFATAGFFMACGRVIFRILRNKKQETIPDHRLTFLSFAILALIIYCIDGGLGVMVAHWVTPELRCLNRVCIVISCISLCILALSMEKLMGNAGKREKILGMSALCLACAFVLYSEVPVKDAGWQVNDQKKDAEYKAFFEKIQQVTDDGDMIYEIPMVPFPENPPVYGLRDYQMGLGYVYTDNLRWSYGGVKGRNLTADLQYYDDGASMDFLKRILNIGYKGVYIDVRGFSDRGEKVLSFYSDELMLIPIVSEDRCLYYYDLSGLRF